jgi:tRNA G18 (ribose-2'-O)-methylase SpoU
MVTDRYLEVVYYKSTDEFLKQNSESEIISIDITKDSKPLNESALPKNAIYVFGSESNGVSQQMLEASSDIIHIEQLGSTRSVNVGVASGIFLYEWVRRSGIL